MEGASISIFYIGWFSLIRWVCAGGTDRRNQQRHQQCVVNMATTTKPDIVMAVQQQVGISLV